MKPVVLKTNIIIISLLAILSLTFAYLLTYNLVFPARIPLNDFHSDWGTKKSPEAYGMKYENIEFRYAPTQPKLSGWFIPAYKETAVLVVEGWGQNRNKALKYSALFNKLGYPVLTFDFRGQGSSEFAPCTLGDQERYDIAAGVNFLKEQKKFKRIILFGVSMGGVSELLYQTEFKSPAVKAIIVDSIYYSYASLLSSWLWEHYRLPAFPVVPLSKIVFTLLTSITPQQISLEQASQINVPVLIFHGEKDLEIPSTNAQKLNKTISSSVLVIIPKAKHGECYTTNSELYLKHLKTFIQSARL